jgi:hypothetical protein
MNNTFLAVILIFYFTNSLFSKEIILKNVKILNQENYSFGELSDLKMKDGKVVSIISNKDKSNSIKYIVPSFCDAGVSFGYDSFGGQNSISDARIFAKSILVHGFTHVISITDPPFIKELKKEIDTGKTIGPEIVIAERPILAFTEEYPKLPDTIYFTGKSDEEILKEAKIQSKTGGKYIRIYHRYYDKNKYYINSLLLHNISDIIKPQNKKLIVNTFADRVSILDSIRSGVEILEHPIPEELIDSFTEDYGKYLKWIPYFNVYNNLTKKTRKSIALEDFTYLSENDFFYKRTYSSRVHLEIERFTDEEESEVLNEYNGYLTFLEKNEQVSNNMILGSGAGNYFSLPGVSGIQELEIIFNTLGNKTELLRIPTENTCNFLGTNYSGKILIGKDANLILYAANPMENFSFFYKPEKIFKAGIEIDLGKIKSGK